MSRLMILFAVSTIVFSQEEPDKVQIDILKKAFQELGHNKEACIGTVMVGTILGMLGPNVTDEGLNKIINEMDEDGISKLDFNDFLAKASEFLKEEDLKVMIQELKEAFSECDKEEFTEEKAGSAD